MELGHRFKEHYARVKDNPGFIAAALSSEITERLYIRMQELGLSQRELARRIGRSQPYVCKLLNDGSNMTLLTLAKLAQALELEVKPLLFKPVRESAKHPKTRRPKVSGVSVGK